MKTRHEVPREGRRRRRALRGVRAALVVSTSALGITTCQDPVAPDANEQRRLSISATGLALGVGDTTTLDATLWSRLDPGERSGAGQEGRIWPYYATVAWHSDDPAVASVDGRGRVTARSAGRTVIRLEAGGVRDSATVRVVVPAPHAARFAALGAGFGTCALDAQRRAYCWGTMSFGQTGGGTERFYTGQASPAAVVGGLEFAQISVGGYHACGLTADGAVHCWGENDFGQLGDATRTVRAAPVRAIEGGTTRFQAVATGNLETCAVALGGGEVTCWGGVAFGARRFAAPRGADGGFTTLTTGQLDHHCATDVAGRAYCWGENGAGELGTGDTLPRARPTAVATELRFASLSAGGRFTCGVTTDGAPYCWGYGARGQLGNGATASSASPVPVAGGLRVARISAGAAHACAVTSDGAAYCWGNDVEGALGSGAPSPTAPPADAFIRPTPQRVAGGRTFVDIVAGALHACGREADGTTWCWGANPRGQLGIGRLGLTDGRSPWSMRWEPTRVVAPE